MSNYNMEANVVTLIKEDKNSNYIFGKDKKYIVPEYQRTYSWCEKEIEQFMASIKRAINGEQVFMGTVQFAYDEECNEYNIIDGQQRMTTFLLLFCLLDEKCGSNVIDKYNLTLEIRNFSLNNKKLSEVLNGTCDNKNNRYLFNFKLLESSINEIEEQPQTIMNAIIKNIYFVALTTKNISLPEVVNIFNTINTTGLDLNCSDLFKLQYYEYLKSTCGKDKDWMHKISVLYEKVNNADGCEISHILDVYKHCIVAKNKWSFDMLSKSNEKFFDEVFNKKNDCNKEILKFREFTRLVRLYIDFYGKYIYKQKNELLPFLISPIDVFAMDLIGTTRYSRYWTMPIVAAYFDTDTDKMKKYANSLHIAVEISKYLIVCSVNYNRVINPSNTFICNKILSILPKQCNVKNIIQEVIRETPYEREREDNPEYNKVEFCRRIKNNLVDNGKRAHIVCLLSALLIEIENKNNLDFNRIYEKFFVWKNFEYDKEHIYAHHLFKDANNEEYALYNGIGNLMVLERSINRGIGDSPIDEKIKEYPRSNFEIVKQITQIIEQKGWGIKQVRENAARQEDLLCNFLFK